MKRFMTWIVISSFMLMLFTGCAYEKAYQSYTNAQADIAKNSGPLIELHSNGQLKSVGNPMLAMMGMNMKAPRSDWDGFWDVLKVALPFAAIYGVVGAMSNAAQGITTNVSGDSNLMNNTTGASSSFASPVTTTTTTTITTPATTPTE